LSRAIRRIPAPPGSAMRPSPEDRSRRASRSCGAVKQGRRTAWSRPPGR
jgi:hypothetical protein